MESVEKKNEWWEWTKALLIAAGLATVIRVFFFSPIIVDGRSMMPTLENGERMIMNKISYQVGEPDYFDIVVFHATEEKDYIKRVIGLPGDHIEYKEDVLYINGEAYEEPYLEPYKEELNGFQLTEDFTLEDIIGQSTVPEGQVFVLGDNRQVSQDSRMIGTVPMDEIVGKTSLVFWPISQIRNAD
nr:signal peptidase I [Bacillus coahuilensis]